MRGAVLALAMLLGFGLVGFHPTKVLARQSMSFSPGERGGHGHAVRTRHHARGARGHSHAGRRHGHPTRSHARPSSRATARHAGSGGGDEGPAAKAVPGKGFTMENGVLTYPAPARFQPQNLKHH